VAAASHQIFHRTTATVANSPPWRVPVGGGGGSPPAPAPAPAPPAAAAAAAAASPDFLQAGAPPGSEGACRSLWQWLGADAGAADHLDCLVAPCGGGGGGGGGGPDDASDTLVQELRARLTAEHVAGDEPLRNAASYALGRLAAGGGGGGVHRAAALAALLEGLVHPSCEGARRVAIHGLSAAGNPAVPGLVSLLRRSLGALHDAAADSESQNLRTVIYAADALGEAAEGSTTWEPALRLLSEIQAALDGVTLHEEAEGSGGVSSSLPPDGVPMKVPWWEPSVDSARKSVLTAIEHITQRAVRVGHAECCALACEALLSALAGPSAGFAVGGLAAALTVAADPRRLLGGAASARLLSQLQAMAMPPRSPPHDQPGGSSCQPYRVRAAAAEALRRLVAPRPRRRRRQPGTTTHASPGALARARHRMLQGLVEAEWSPPEEDPRQNGLLAGGPRSDDAKSGAQHFND
jgi:hypothetical protein